MFWWGFCIIYSHRNGSQNFSNHFCRMFCVERRVYIKYHLESLKFCLYAVQFTLQVNSYMINSCRTWLIFPTTDISNLALDGIYFPNMSIEISTISLRANDITVVCITPTKCSIHSGYCHTCAYAFLCNSNTWILWYTHSIWVQIHTRVLPRSI